MTSLALTARRIGIRVTGMRIEAIVAAIVALAVAAAVVLTLFPARNPATASTVTLPITPAKANALIAATSGDASVQMSAIGDRAKLINAASPLGPVRKQFRSTPRASLPYPGGLL